MFNLSSMEKRSYRSKARVLANILTLTRFFLGLPIIICLSYSLELSAWLFFLIGGLSDWLDGYFARLSGGGTVLGARLDPLADKVLIMSPLIWIASNSLLPIPLWAIWLLISREFVISIWRTGQSFGAPASKQAKLKTLLQFISLLLIMWPISFGGEQVKYSMQLYGLILFWPSLLLAITSAIAYITKQIIIGQKRNR